MISIITKFKNNNAKDFRLSSHSLVTYTGQARYVMVQNTNLNFKDEKV